MITKKDVELAGKIAELGKKLREAHDAQLRETMAEEKRREEWAKQHHARGGAVRALQREVELAGEAQARIYMLVPIQLRQAADAAAAAHRGLADGVAHERSMHMDAQDRLDRRLRAAREPGADPVTKEERRAMDERVAASKASYEAAQKQQAEYEQRAKDARARVEAEAEKVRKQAK